VYSIYNCKMRKQTYTNNYEQRFITDLPQLLKKLWTTGMCTHFTYSDSWTFMKQK
jgi:hypothetical protein